MTAPNADQRRPGGGDAVETCTQRIARLADSREPISLAEALLLLDDPWFRLLYELVFGYFEDAVERRVEDLVAERRRVDRDLDGGPSFVELQRLRHQFRGIGGQPVVARTPAAIRAAAEYSWRRAERVEQQGRRAG